MKSVYVLMTLAALATGLHAQVVLEAVPRQGGMLMPEVWYHADSDSVTVDLSALYDVNGNPIIAQLTPLLVSDPGDRFDPASPWYAYLDPSQQGLSFTRRYGYDMDVMTDYVPGDRALFIRNLGSSPELGFYNYMDAEYNPTGAAPTWDPILGTAGTSNSIYWNQGMWHMGVAARPAPAGTTNLYFANIEVYVVNTITGEEVTNSGFSFILQWTDIPDGRPTLAINTVATNNVLVSWPASTVTNWYLVSSTKLSATNWMVVTNPVVTTTNWSTVLLNSQSAQQFFRMEYFP